MEVTGGVTDEGKEAIGPSFVKFVICRILFVRCM